MYYSEIYLEFDTLATISLRSYQTKSGFFSSVKGYIETTKSILDFRIKKTKHLNK